MANPEHLEILQQGVNGWNPWRAKEPSLIPDLREAALRDQDLHGLDLREADLRGANLARTYLNAAQLTGAKLLGADLSEADLTGADLSGADLSCANLTQADLNHANLPKTDFAWAKFTRADLSRANLEEANLNGADLSGASLLWANLNRANLRDKAVLNGANLSHADLRGADLTRANLTRANLSGANLTRADLEWADLRDAILRDANLSHADLTRANLSHADLRHARLIEADLREANLTAADLSTANLSRAQLVKTNLVDATLTDCRIYGISAWDVTFSEGTKQQGLIITPSNEPAVTVDALEVAQFVYLLLHNEKLRKVIDTVTSKVVLILGRFTPERKVVLDALREELRNRHYVPILFDFDVPAERDITETVSLLARMSRFIIADLTDPRSIPKELEAIVPHLAVPVQPLLEGDRPYAMFKDYWKYDWVLAVHRYEGLPSLLGTLAEKVIAPAERNMNDLAEKRQRFEAELIRPE
jgi:uncharacterized protein YjbI with pentapeptide repeats